MRVVVAFAVTVGICWFLDQKAFDYLEQYAYNLRQAVYAARDRPAVRAAQQRIKLVTLSDEAIARFALPGTLTVPRNHHAKVIRELTRAGARVIAFDLLFDADSPYDAELAAAAQRSGKVVWGSMSADEADSAHQRIVRPNRRLLQAGPHFGHLLLQRDPDLPAADRIAAVVINDGHPVPALSLKAIMMAQGLDEKLIRRSQEGWRIGPHLTIPIDKAGCFRVSYLGKPGEIFTPIPYEQIYDGAVDDEFYKSYFNGKIVLIGDTSSATSDYHYTPVGDMTGVEIHAHAIATLLRGRFVGEAPPWLNLLVICLLAGLVCPLAAVCNLPCAGLATGGLLGGYFLINTWLFSDYGTWLHLVAPASAALVGALGLFGERALTEEREKKRMRWLLRRYVSPEIAEYIIANPRACVLGGDRASATVLFADIRGFTAISEQLSPEAVVKCLNEYFEAMTPVAFAHDGTVDKYVGDAIMVLFGIPVPCPDHAHRAVATAIDMQAAMLDLQRRWQAEGVPLIDIGIGINTGVMVAGSIGSTQRLEFTVIGDDVNIAAHTEHLSKQVGARILVTQSTYEAVKDQVLARGPLTGVVKGKELIAYEITGWRGS